MIYELIEIRSEPGKFVIQLTVEDGTVYWIPMDEANADYQQYLVNTDGGLPIPKVK